MTDKTIKETDERYITDDFGMNAEDIAELAARAPLLMSPDAPLLECARAVRRPVEEPLAEVVNAQDCRGPAESPTILAREGGEWAHSSSAKTGLCFRKR